MRPAFAIKDLYFNISCEFIIPSKDHNTTEMILWSCLMCDFTASRMNGVCDLNCRSFFILLSSLSLIIGTFVTESTAVLCCTEPSTAFKNTLTSEQFAITRNVLENK